MLEFCEVMHRCRVAFLGVALSSLLVRSVVVADSVAAVDAVVREVNVATLEYYHQDLLHTWLGDNRGFGAEHDRAAFNIVFAMSGLGCSIELEPFQFKGGQCYNIVMTQVGRERPDEIYVVGAHFDSVNNPGADDNATGTALVMEVARVLSRHRAGATIKYVFFDREEQGQAGSESFVELHADENVVVAVTTDMVGHDSGAYGMEIYGMPESGEVVAGMAFAIGRYGGSLAVKVNVGDYDFSDHWAFESAGIPACVIIEDDYRKNAYYHTAEDAVDIRPGYINYELVGDLTRSVVAYIAEQADVTVFGDIDGDGNVGEDDVAAFRLQFNRPVSEGGDMFDVNGDGVVDCADWRTIGATYALASDSEVGLSVDEFVLAIVGAESDPVHVCRADANGDGGVDEADIGPFVKRLLGEGGAPRRGRLPAGWPG